MAVSSEQCYFLFCAFLNAANYLWLLGITFGIEKESYFLKSDNPKQQEGMVSEALMTHPG